jgi:hypothetical protein
MARRPSAVMAMALIPNARLVIMQWVALFSAPGCHSLKVSSLAALRIRLLAVTAAAVTRPVCPRRTYSEIDQRRWRIEVG